MCPSNDWASGRWSCSSCGPGGSAVAQEGDADADEPDDRSETEHHLDRFEVRDDRDESGDCGDDADDVQPARQPCGDQPGDRHEQDPDATDELVAATESVGDGVEGRPDRDGPIGIRGGEVGDRFDADVGDHPGGVHEGRPDRGEHHAGVREQRRVGESSTQRESERDERCAEHDEDADVPGEQRPLVPDEEVDRLRGRGVGIGVVGEDRRKHRDAVEEGSGGEQRSGAADAVDSAGSLSAMSPCRGVVVVMVGCLSLDCCGGGLEWCRSGPRDPDRVVGARSPRRSSR